LGYGLVVARRKVTLVDDVRTLINELKVDRADVVGTVLNEA
jgi:Mrp family chromosome partitioning ATPase